MHRGCVGCGRGRRLVTAPLARLGIARVHNLRLAVCRAALVVVRWRRRRARRISTDPVPGLPWRVHQVMRLLLGAWRPQVEGGAPLAPVVVVLQGGLTLQPLRLQLLQEPHALHLLVGTLALRTVAHPHVEVTHAAAVEPAPTCARATRGVRTTDLTMGWGAMSIRKSYISSLDIAPDTSFSWRTVHKPPSVASASRSDRAHPSAGLCEGEHGGRGRTSRVFRPFLRTSCQARQASSAMKMWQALAKHALVSLLIIS